MSFPVNWAFNGNRNKKKVLVLWYYRILEFFKSAVLVFWGCKRTFFKIKNHLLRWWFVHFQSSNQIQNLAWLQFSPIILRNNNFDWLIKYIPLLNHKIHQFSLADHDCLPGETSKSNYTLFVLEFTKSDSVLKDYRVLVRKEQVDHPMKSIKLEHCRC